MTGQGYICGSRGSTGQLEAYLGQAGASTGHARLNRVHPPSLGFVWSCRGFVWAKRDLACPVWAKQGASSGWVGLQLPEQGCTGQVGAEPGQAVVLSGQAGASFILSGVKECLCLPSLGWQLAKQGL